MAGGRRAAGGGNTEQAVQQHTAALPAWPALRPHANRAYDHFLKRMGDAETY
jgi:hypothetical protein